MKQMNHMTRILVIVFSAILLLSGLAMAQNPKTMAPCSILTKAEIKAVIGQDVSDGKLTGSGNAAAGAPCQYTVGAGGVFSVLSKVAAPGENAPKVMEELKKRKIPVVDAPGIGDRSFFSSPGYGMVQLNTFKGPHYLIITMLVPGLSEAAQKTAATTLMNKALKKF
ncbi:MAG: hypothetical protein WC799_00595 [Desulfobacteraceae bacterium]